jgi:2-polyprenyl-6-hydroxyphenyl methylase/3-demethylubiquinone-9 3-methyltransferase
MPSSQELTSIESHFAFGKNWASYAQKIDSEEIDEAVNELTRLLGGGLDGKRFLDIGCGSGLHSLAAFRLGASSVTSVDLDADSVATTRAVLMRHAPDAVHDVRRLSVLEMSSADFGGFDVVYSWGVLHHTGQMHEALRRAAAFVAPGGEFIIALYRKTWSCWFWRLEKRWYSRASARAQSVADRLYISLFALALSMTGRSFDEYVQSYGCRGMDYHHDVKDWLGGYPYESISVKEVDDLMTELGLQRRRVFARRGRFLGRCLGLFDSGCDEFVYVRP